MRVPQGRHLISILFRVILLRLQGGLKTSTLLLHLAEASGAVALNSHRP